MSKENGSITLLESYLEKPVGLRQFAGKRDNFNIQIASNDIQTMALMLLRTIAESKEDNFDFSISFSLPKSIRKVYKELYDQLTKQGVE